MGKTNTKSNKTIRKIGKKWLVAFVVLLSVGLAAAFGYGLFSQSSSETSAADTLPEKESPTVNRLVGNWVRPDGGYVIEINKIYPDGKADAAYYNPRSINVAKASVSEIDGELGLFVKLEDQGYPGSIYTLKYNPEYDAMVGVYFQAAMQQSFDVFFQRK